MSQTRRNTASLKNLGKGPITSAAIERWFEWLNTFGHEHEDPSRKKVDPRLIAIPPAIEGVLVGLRGYAARRPAARKIEIERMAKRAAVGLPADIYRRDRRRADVVCDWTLRCALPLWLDRLPAWCGARMCAASLRALSPTLWTQQIVDDLAVLSPAWRSLQADARDGTSAERAIIRNVHQRASSVMAALTAALDNSLRESDGMPYADEYRCRRAMREMIFTGDDWDKAIAKTLPGLVDVLLNVHPGDSQRSVADRCTWGSIAAKKRTA